MFFLRGEICVWPQEGSSRLGGRVLWRFSGKRPAVAAAMAGKRRRWRLGARSFAAANQGMTIDRTIDRINRRPQAQCLGGKKKN